MHSSQGNHHLSKEHHHPSNGMHSKSRYLSSTLCDPVDCSPPGSSAHGIVLARVLERVAVPSPGSSARGIVRARVLERVAVPSPGISPPREGAQVCIGRRFFTTDATGEAHPSSGWCQTLHIFSVSSFLPSSSSTYLWTVLQNSSPVF